MNETTRKLTLAYHNSGDALKNSLNMFKFLELLRIIRSLEKNGVVEKVKIPHPPSKIRQLLATECLAIAAHTLLFLSEEIRTRSEGKGNPMSSWPQNKDDSAENIAGLLMKKARELLENN